MNANRVVVCAALFLTFSCGVQETSVSEKPESSTISLYEKPTFAESSATLSSAKLREYCKACHAVGSLRFIYDESDSNLWRYILTNKVPGKSELWANAIVRVLSWPTNTPPAPTPVMDPPSGKDWMPKGSKRLHFAADKIEGVSARTYVLDAIKRDLPK